MNCAKFNHLKGEKWDENKYIPVEDHPMLGLHTPNHTELPLSQKDMPQSCRTPTPKFAGSTVFHSGVVASIIIFRLSN